MGPADAAPRPFRFSLQAVEASSGQAWRELARRAEDLGFDALMTADHLGGCLSPLAPLVSAADVTQRLRLGVMVLNNDFHHPVLLAREAATVDLLTDGRLELGLGEATPDPSTSRPAWPSTRRRCGWPGWPSRWPCCAACWTVRPSTSPASTTT